jgi:phosphoglucosamine mutase
LFGTDGVRDVANRGSMTPEMALRLGRAFVLFLAERGVQRPRIVTGRDTRRSGTMLDCAIASGMASAGAEVTQVGVLPTPGVSFAVLRTGADGGAVVSASHNPAEYNGIKFIDGDGRKLSDEAEARVEELLGDDLADEWRPTGACVGEVKAGDEAECYAARLASIADWRRDWRLLFDCANGAASGVMQSMAARLGADWAFTGVEPDGMNINEGVGVMNIGHLCRMAAEGGFDAGFAFDGDADRALMADSSGRVIDGDMEIWILARWLARRGALGSGVVVTMMSNSALDERLRLDGIEVFRCPVGDRYVLGEMMRRGARLGGEQSGHIIIDSLARTGDGICTAMCVLTACRDMGEDIGTLADRFARFPQRLSSLPTSGRALNLDEIRAAAAEAERMVEGRGRIFIRPSGTEPLLRVLVEAADDALADEASALLMAALGERLRL